MTRPLRILQVAQPPDGGAAEHVRLLSLHLARQGHEVTVVGPPGSMLAAPAAVPPGWRFVAVPSLVREPGPSDMSAVLTMRRLFREEPWDVIHLHSSKAGFVGRVAAVATRTDSVVLYTPHCFAFLARMPRVKRMVYEGIERALRGVGDGVILVSEWEREASLASGVVLSERSWVIHNGADPFRGRRDGDATPAEHGDPPTRADGPGRLAPAVAEALASVPRDGSGRPSVALVGTVTRLRPEKGATDFVRLAARVAAARPEAHFVLVGDGPQRDECADLARSLGLADTLHIVGFREDVADFLAAFDVFVLTSLQESFPLAILEAMAVGLPTVATAVGGVKEMVVPGVTGYVFPVGSEAGPAEAVARLLSTPEERRAMGEAARRRYVDLFVPEVFAERTLQLYRTLAARRGRSDGEAAR